MPTVPNGKPNGTANGNHFNGHSMGSVKLSEKPDGVTPGRDTRPPGLFSKKFNALFAFAFLGAVWAATHSYNTVARTYALCSRDGDHIYTVDGNNARVECVVVRDAHILDTGSLCRYIHSIHAE
jgi:hypothetical protein